MCHIFEGFSPEWSRLAMTKSWCEATSLALSLSLLGTAHSAHATTLFSFTTQLIRGILFFFLLLLLLFSTLIRKSCTFDSKHFKLPICKTFFVHRRVECLHVYSKWHCSVHSLASLSRAKPKCINKSIWIIDCIVAGRFFSLSASASIHILLLAVVSVRSSSFMSYIFFSSFDCILCRFICIIFSLDIVQIFFMFPDDSVVYKRRSETMLSYSCCSSALEDCVFLVPFVACASLNHDQMQ